MYSVFNEKVGTISNHTSFKEAHKSAKKYAKQMNHYFTIFEEKNGNIPAQKLVKWVFPRKK